MGPVEVPADRYWGAQTQRSLEHFRIGGAGDRMPLELVHALALVKKVAALANHELGVLGARERDLIVRAADEVAAGVLDDPFPLVVWQTGSGTQTNMNVNEVVANRANELAGAPLGSKSPVHPNDHVNRSHSSNDAFPTAMHVAVVARVEEHLVPAADRLRQTLAARAAQFAHVVKLGRTHLQDATPVTVGQEMGAWATQLGHAIDAIHGALPRLYELALGGTAVGTGLNAPAGFAESTAAHLATLTGRPFVTAPDKLAALAAHDALVSLHGAVEQLAVACTKIANDVRLLASGPRAGLAELRIPENEPGSSIMPGKVNPTQAEALTMVAAQVLGHHTTIAFAASQGHLQLNVFKPVIAFSVLRSVALLGDACASFELHCARGIVPNVPEIERHLAASLMLVTALTPRIGYDAAARVAEHAHAYGLTLREAALALGVLTGDEFDALVRPVDMVAPSKSP